MTTSSTLPDYTELTHALENTPSQLDASQLHGLFCGFIVASKGQASNYCDTILQGTKHVPEIRDLLQNLFETSYHQMSNFSFEFALMLPDDNSDIKTRTESLGLWCQGFLTGLEQYNIPMENREEGEITDALTDLIEIAQVSFDDITDSEEDETAYFELVEYVRLAVLMLFQELTGPENNPASSEDSGSLH